MKALNPSTGQFETIYVKALDSLPVGIVLEYPTTDSSKLPTGYMFCDGSAISRTEYSELFGLIGTQFGVGDGSTTFNLPTKAGLVSVGINSNDTDFDTIGETGGSKYLQNHKHPTYVDRNTGTTGTGSYYPATQITTASNYVDNNICEPVGDGNSGNLQPYIVTNYIIKVKQTRPLAGTVTNTYSESQTSAYSCDYINGTVLYENASGTQNNFTLNDNVSNYTRIDIICKHWYFDKQKVFTFYNVNGQSLNLDMTVGDNGTMYFTTSTITMTGTSATIGNSYATNTYGWSQATSFASAFGTISQDNNARFKIFKVIGYK